MKGLDIKELNWPFEHAHFVSDHDLIERQVVFDERFVFFHDDSAAVGVEWGQDVVFGQVDGQLDELAMQIFHQFRTAFDKEVLQGDADIGIEKIDVAVGVILCTSQVDGIFEHNGL